MLFFTVLCTPWLYCTALYCIAPYITVQYSMLQCGVVCGDQKGYLSVLYAFHRYNYVSMSCFLQYCVLPSLYCTALYCIAPYITVQYSMLQYAVVCGGCSEYSSILYVSYSILLYICHGTMLFFTVLCTPVTILHCIVLYCTVYHFAV